MSVPHHQTVVGRLSAVRLTAFLLLSGLLLAVPLSATANAQDVPATRTAPTHPFAVHIEEAARRFGIPAAWIRAVMRAESAGDVHAISSAGAMGLMQIMPDTWAELRVRHRLGRDPYDPRDNIIAGTSYLREMYDSYGASGFLAAYNAGPGRYQDWRDRGRPLPAETRAYVAKIAPMLQTGSAATVVASTSPVQPARPSWTQGQLFAVRGGAAADATGSFAAAVPPTSIRASSAPLNGLFAPVSGSRPQ